MTVYSQILSDFTQHINHAPESIRLSEYENAIQHCKLFKVPQNNHRIDSSGTVYQAFRRSYADSPQCVTMLYLCCESHVLIPSGHQNPLITKDHRSHARIYYEILAGHAKSISHVFAKSSYLCKILSLPFITRPPILFIFITGEQAGRITGYSFHIPSQPLSPPILVVWLSRESMRSKHYKCSIVTCNVYLLL